MKNKIILSLVFFFILVSGLLLFSRTLYAQTNENRSQLRDLINLLLGTNFGDYSFGDSSPNGSSGDSNQRPDQPPSSGGSGDQPPPPQNIGEGYNRLIAVIDKINDPNNTDCKIGTTLGRLNRSNYIQCLKTVKDQLPTQTYEIWTREIYAFNNLQCVGKVKGDPPFFDSPHLASGVGVARNYKVRYQNSTRDYKYIENTSANTVAPGDFVLWNCGAAGHIAFVLQVFSPDRIEIEESNFECPGCVRRTVTNVQGGDGRCRIMGWLRKL